MNLILDELPVISPNGYKLSTDFRNAMRFEILMQDNKIDKELKIKLALNLFYENIPSDVIKAINDVIWFYSGEDNKLVKENKKTSNNSFSRGIYSFEFDSEYIFSAFLDQYGIDLNSIEYLHWWKFKAMFKSLKEDNQIVKIMGYRAIDLSKIKDKDEKKRYKELKKVYALPDMRTKEQKERDFGNAFW